MDDTTVSVHLDAGQAEEIRGRAAAVGLTVEEYARQQLVGDTMSVEQFAVQAAAWITEVAPEFAAADAAADRAA